MSTIPIPVTAEIVGRESYLKELERLLASRLSLGRFVIIHGPDGIGKSRVAAEFAHRHRGKYDFVGWLQADSPLTLDIEFARFASDLNLPEKDPLDLKNAIKAVRRWLHENPNWLLVFDDAKQLGRIRQYLPSKPGGSVLLTTCEPVRKGGPEVMPLDRLSRKESTLWLRRLNGRRTEKHASALAEALRDMPLALEQAGSCLNDTRMSFAEYLEMFQRLAGSHAHKTQRTSEDRRLLLTTAAISARQVQEHFPGAAELLKLCSFFAPYRIPLNTIRLAMPHLPDALAEVAAKTTAFKRAVNTLRQSCLISVTEDTINVPETVQTATRNQLGSEDRKVYAEIAVLLLNDAMRSERKVTGRTNALSLTPHALTAARHARREKVAYQTTTLLLNQAALYLESRGELKEAEAVNRKALKAGELAYGANHAANAAIHKSLGDILHKLERVDEARSHYESALRIAEATYSSNNPFVAVIIRGIGDTLQAGGRLLEAVDLLQRALKIDESSYGEDSIRLAPPLNKIGQILEELDRQAEAEPFYKRSVAILTAQRGEEHAETIAAEAGLSRVQKELERLAVSQVRHEKAVEATGAFLREVCNSTRMENGRFFRIDRIRGRLKLFAPLPVLVSTDSLTRQDIISLFETSNSLARKNLKRAAVLIYHEHPDVFVQMQIAELRSKNGFIMIPIPLAAIEQAVLDISTCSGVLAHYSQNYLPGADLFDDRNAIGDTLSFFGRSDLLHFIEGDLVQHQALGLFGLRKSGKTSVLLQLGFALREHPVIHIDLQPYGGRPRFGAELFNEILQRLSLLLSGRAKTQAYERFPDDAPAASISSGFVQRAVALADQLRQVSYAFPALIFLDEVERILPTPQDPAVKVEEFNAFLGSLRALSQQHRKFGILIADVHPDCNRINYWAQPGLPSNPVNQFFKECFLEPFSQDDTSTMIENIGRLMGRTFDDKTLSAIHRESGGHPFVARQLASLLCSKLSEQKEASIAWASARRYIEKPFYHSGVLKDYFEHNIVGDIKMRRLDSALAVLKSLAVNEQTSSFVSEEELLGRLENFKIGEINDAILWLESVGLLTQEVQNEEQKYGIRLPLLSQYFRMGMSQKEKTQWQT